MSRITALTRTVALAATALAAVSLTACGTEKPSTDPAGARRTQAAAVSGQETAFAAMLEDVARSCPAHGPRAGYPTDPPADDPATEELEGPIAPTAGPEVELDARDWCAKHHHEERVAQALWNLANPTPAEVRKILNGLGYTDERIHGLERSGPATRFLIDLRDKGGRLYLDGSAAGEQTLVEGLVAPRTGPLPLTRR
ncbi:hypothetical protein ACIQ6Y_05130 [Streptomyces sp. NPDC096205]|uniref:hypothetical protein n=1 Tax=Streptomyces sp. NPDC096205 TaxID=3366081 RepID=UPI0038017E57